MAPGFQRLVNKWVNITRNTEVNDDGLNHGSKVKSEDHSTRTAEISTACSSYYGGNPIDNGNHDDQSNQFTVSDAVQAVESLSMRASEDEAMTEDESWSMEEESRVEVFLHRIADFVEKKNDIPFDLIELWVPVYSSDIPKLCHAGHLVTSNASRDDNKYEFGHSSMMHSFEPGNGIPGKQIFYLNEIAQL